MKNYKHIFGLFAVAIMAVIGTVSVVQAQAVTVAENFRFYTDLTIGSRGTDVIALQTFLENRGLMVMPAGVAKGYFGPITQAAVARYQAANTIAPAVGYFGPITRTHVNMVLGSGTTVTLPPGCQPGYTFSATTGARCDSGSTGGSTGGGSTSGALRGGEASLEQFDFSSGDDSDVEEGSSAEIAEIEFDVEDGDVRVNRIDMQLVADTDNEEEDPWDTFDSLRLFADGREIGEIDLSDEDEYLDEDDGTFRLSNLDYIVREGSTANIIVEITAQNNVDGADENLADWTINVLDDGIRATDAAGIEQYVGSDSDTVAFSVEVEGEGEELSVSSSDEDPNPSTFKVEDDSRSDWYSVFAFEVEAEESDIEIDTVQIVIETGTANVQNVISDLILEIDGDEFDDWRYVSGGGTTEAIVEFDIDGDFVLDADDEVTVVLMAEFKAANGTNYAASGETILASIEDEAIEGEGADDVVSDGATSGEEHNLAISGIVIPVSGFDDQGSNSNNDANTSRDYTFTFEVTAFEEDFYIATSSVNIFVEGPGSATVNYTVDSTADEDTNDVFTVEEGDTETFTVTVTLSNVSATGQYRVGLDSVDYTENSNGTTGTETLDVMNSDFRTSYRTINQ